MSYPRMKTGLSLLGIGLLAVSTTVSRADDLSPFDRIILTDSAHSWGTWDDTPGDPAGTPSVGASRSALGRVLGRSTVNAAQQRTVVNLVGEFGMVIDYSSGLPRVGGFSLSPSDDVRVEASGGIGDGFGDVSGQVSIHFRF